MDTIISNVLKSYYDFNPPWKCQLDSFSHFINVMIPRILVGNTIKFDDDVLMIQSVEVKRTEQYYTPDECIERKLTYHYDLILTGSLSKGSTMSFVIGKIPMMITEGEMRGYFIIEGQMKMITMEEKIRYNIPFLLKKKKIPRYISCIEVKSVSGILRSSILSIGKLSAKNDNILLYIPEWSTDPIPFGLVITLFLSQEEVIAWMESHEESSFIKSSKCIMIKNLNLEYAYSQWCDHYLKYKKSLTEELTRRAISFKLPMSLKQFKEVLETNKQQILKIIVPHIEDIDRRSYYLCYLFAYYIKYLLGIIPLTDRDHYGKKIVYSASHVLSSQLFHSFQKFKHSIIKKKSTSSSLIDSCNTAITSGMSICLTTNNWYGKKDQNIAHQFDPYNWYCYLSSIRSIETPVKNESNKIIGPRELHCSQAGILCLYETPDGKKVGLKKHLAVGCVMSFCQSRLLKTIILSECSDLLSNSGRIIVFINGDWIACIDDYQPLVDKIKQLRRSEIISIETSVYFDKVSMNIHISDDIGRLLRPILNLDKVHLLQSFSDFHDLIRLGVVELIDKLEEENMLIQTSDILTSTSNFGYCELFTFFSLGYNANRIPYSNHNQSPRNLYQCQMAKHSMASYLSRQFIGTQVNILMYPQLPLVNPMINHMVDFYEHPNGVMLRVAIMPFMGQNQEDSIIFNKSSIQRGLFNSIRNITITHLVYSLNKTAKPLDSEAITLVGMNFDKLGIDGILAIKKGKEVIVKSSDVLVAVREIRGHKEFFNKQKSLIYREKEPLRVQRVTAITSNKGDKVIKIYGYQIRIPEVGDKFSCYDSITEVLTTDGWILFKALTLEHRVAQVTDDFELEYVNPSEVQSYDYEGDMYSVETQGISLLVTPNHNLLTACHGTENYNLQRADVLAGKIRRYRKHIDNVKTVHKIEKVRIGKFEIDIDEWLIFYGIWIGEGWCYNGAIEIAAYKQRVQDALNEVSITFKKKGNYWSFRDKNIYNWLKPASGAYNKYLHKFVWSLSTTQCRLLLHALILGNGHTMANGTRRYDTSSPQLVEDIQRLCVHAGWCSSMILKYPAGHVNAPINGKPIVQNYDAFRLTIIETQIKPTINIKGRKHDKWIYYKGKVYCCTVPTHKLIIRRNKKVIVCGNSLSGQKGTMGMYYPSEDLPFDCSGVSPDAIINPLCIPSRMTIGHMLEMISGLELTKRSNNTYCSICVQYKRDLSKRCETDCILTQNVKNYCYHSAFYNTLIPKHFKDYSGEVFYDGMTGRKLSGLIFNGYIYYQRLKHVATDKLHLRTKGPLQAITRQPREGRSVDGGHRFGTMERDNAAAHGLMATLRERLFEQSDKAVVRVCKDCGVIYHNSPPEVTDEKCKGCGCETIVDIEFPFGSKTLIQYMYAFNINIKLIPE